MPYQVQALNIKGIEVVGIERVGCLEELFQVKIICKNYDIKSEMKNSIIYLVSGGTSATLPLIEDKTCKRDKSVSIESICGTDATNRRIIPGTQQMQ